MKPTFALNLSNESVGLLHRTPRGWLEIGTASFADPDLSDALSYLRSNALGLSPRAITTQLVIPNSQILYLEIEAPGPDAAARRRQIKAALKEKTSIPAEDLVFDWSGKGQTVQVAALDRLTLEEAEAFAVENRFNPLSFVAIPDPALFKGVPWFGVTKVSASILATGEKVERETEVITITPRELPKPEPVIEEPVAAEAVVNTERTDEATPSAADAAHDEAFIAPEPELPKEGLPDLVLPEAAPQEPDAPEPPPLREAAPQPAAAPEPDPVAERSASNFVAPKQVARPAAAFPPPSPTPAPMSPAAAKAQPVVGKLDKMRYTPAAPSADQAEEAPMALDVPSPAPAPEINDLPEDDLPPPPSAAAMAAFASRRSDTVVPRPLASPAFGKPPMPGVAAGKPMVERPAMARPAPKMPAEGLAGRNDGAPRPLVAPPKPLAKPEVAKPEAPKRTLKGLGALVTATSIPGARKQKVESAAVGPAPIPATPVPQTPAPPPLQSGKSAAKPMTKAAPNAFGSKPMPTRGKPKYLGLILTGVLLLFLALVALWSKLYLASSDQPADTTFASATAPAASQPTAAELQDLSAAEAEADGEDVGLMATPATTEAAVTDASTANQPTPAVSTSGAETAAATAAPDTVVGTEAATVASPSPENQDEIFLAAMDAPPATVDPVALTAPSARGDPLPAAQLPPPPFGTVYQFDADGNILPTPEGIITPEGVRLVAGPPSKVPPERPASAQAATALPVSAAQASTAPVAPNATINTFEAIPALAGARPRLRPAGLVPAQQGEADPSLAVPSDSRFASLRPKLRPASMTASPEETRLATATASLANPQAIAVSLVPAQRPKAMSRAVEAAVASAAIAPEPEQVAAAQPAPEPEPAVAAKPQKPQKPIEPEAEEEPEVATNENAPQLRGTVAKKATFVNAINLGKTNLIGVYGTPAKRYALVRLGSGRYKKVKVGDSVDGGKVVSIATNEVKYQKGGSVLTLAMPKGTD